MNKEMDMFCKGICLPCGTIDLVPYLEEVEKETGLALTDNWTMPLSIYNVHVKNIYQHLVLEGEVIPLFKKVFEAFRTVNLLIEDFPSDKHLAVAVNIYLDNIVTDVSIILTAIALYRGNSPC